MRHPGSGRYPQTGWTMTTEKTDAVGPGRGGRMSRQRKRDAVLRLLRFAAIFQISDAVQVASAGALRGLKDTRVPMVITAVAYWMMGMPIGFILAFGQDMRTPGLWVGMIAALSIAAALLFARFLTLSQKLAR